jgi:hypothetical protein
MARIKQDKMPAKNTIFFIAVMVYAAFMVVRFVRLR